MTPSREGARGPSTGKSSNSSSSSRGATGFFVVSSVLSLSASLGGMYLRLFACGFTFDMVRVTQAWPKTL